MRQLLKPDIRCNSIFDINLEILTEKGIKGLLLDVDNTLAMWKSMSVEANVRLWLDNIKTKGIKVCLVSNGKKKRIISMAKDLDIWYVYQAKKPAKSGFLKALKLLNTKASETALIGDQIFTDILGGNRLGLLTILVEPINRNYEFVSTKLLRIMEKLVLK